MSREALEALRRAFDAGLASPVAGREEAPDAMLAIRVAGEPFAVRIAELEGLHAERGITPVPGGPPELLGLAGLRGRPIAAYDLALLLGLGGPPERGDPPRRRWLLVCRADPSVGLAFEALDGYLAVPRGGPAAAGERGAVREHVQVDGNARAVIGVGALLADLAERSRRSARRRKEAQA